MVHGPTSRRASRGASVLDAAVDLYLTYTGMEPDLIFTKGVDLPGFASCPLHETETGKAQLRGYCTDLITVARRAGTGAIPEAPTWVAQRDRGAALGHGPEDLARANRRAIALVAEARAAAGNEPVIISGNIGPREDAYASGTRTSIMAARQYHGAQVAMLSETLVDVVSGYTIACPQEAAGLVLAARDHRLPVVIAFTLETDGYAAYFMINCAHPDHFAGVLEDAPWMQRIAGIVADDSRCSHAELDMAETLDDGNPVELADALAAIRTRFAHIRVLGGCCGTDMRHMARIAALAQTTGNPR